jgi:2-oxoglutarate/2-oxoacid ferredoxin oxidoreductase subunit alpha
MSDLDLAMNTWMSAAVRVSGAAARSGEGARRGDARADREWGRYKDVDGDGIPYRTIPGTSMPAYFTRGSGHNEKGQYSERPDDYVRNMDRLARKFETARQHVPKPEVEHIEGTEVGIIGYGTSHWALRRAATSSPASAACAPRTCACARIRSRRSSTSSSTATGASTSSSRTVTRRCSR